MVPTKEALADAARLLAELHNELDKICSATAGMMDALAEHIERLEHDELEENE